MVRIKCPFGMYVKSVTGDTIELTESRVDAFDFDTMPSDKEQEEWKSMLLTTDSNFQYAFVEE